MDFKIGELNPNTPHLFADLVELLLTIGYTEPGLHRNDLLSLLENGDISVDELDQEEEAEEEAENTGKTSAEKNNRHENQLDDVLTQLAYRSSALNGYYPFSLAENELILLDKQTLTEKQRVYHFLLACSRLRSFENNGIRQQWAKGFTHLCKFAMCGLVPSHALVRIFDVNSEDRKNYYSNDLRKALKKLGEDLGAVNVDEKACNNAGTSGDAGIDLVAIIKFDDGAATSFALLGQCGAQEKEWPKKTLEAHSIRLYGYFNLLRVEHPNLMFTPVCYRTADGTWTDIQSATGVLLLDRLRILKLLDLQNRWHEIVTSTWFLEFEASFYNASSDG